MFSLSAHHIEEIAPFPELAELVCDMTLENANTDKFLRLCAVNGCVRTFLTLLPNTNYVTGPLTLLAGLNAVDVAQLLNISTIDPGPWERAARRAAKSGHLEFVEYIFSRIDSQKIREAAINGACIGDNIEILKMLYPTIEGNSCLNHLPILAAQHNALECMRYMLDGISGRVWTSALAAALTKDDVTLSDMMLDYIPQHIEIETEYAIKLALRGDGKGKVKGKDPQKLLRFVFQFISLEDIKKVRPQLPPVLLQHMIDAHQYVVLTAAISGIPNVVSKRKM